MTTDQTTAPSRSGDLLSAVGRFWWLVLLLILLGAGAGASWATYAPPYYESRVTLVVKIPEGADSETLVRTVEALITSSAVLDVVADDSGLGLSEEAVQDRLSVERPTGSAVIEVVAGGRDPDTVEAIASEVVPALEQAIVNLPDEGDALDSRPPLEVTSLQLDPEVIEIQRALVRDTALGGLAGLVLGILLAATIAGRRR